MKIRITLVILTGISLLLSQGCHYSLSGAATTAKTISIDQFYNNTDLAPANLAATFTNKLKDYFLQNSSLKVEQENGELHMEGIIMEYSINPIAPTASTSADQRNLAALTRLKISIKINYNDQASPQNSFKDKVFSFYQDFDSNLDFVGIQEDLERKIFDQIFIDIFNATIANW